MIVGMINMYNEIVIEITAEAKAFNLALDDIDCNRELKEFDEQISEFEKKIKELEKMKCKVIEKYTNYYLIKAMKKKSES